MLNHTGTGGKKKKTTSVILLMLLLRIWYFVHDEFNMFLGAALTFVPEASASQASPWSWPSPTVHLCLSVLCFTEDV